MDRVLEILKRHCDQWRTVIPLMQAGKIGTHENGRDTTEQSIADCERLLSDTEALIAKHEARDA